MLKPDESASGRRQPPDTMASGGRQPPESARCWLLAALLAIAFHPAPSSAIVVLTKGSPQPVMGHLVRQDDRVVVVREELPGGKTRNTPIARGEIDEVIVTVAPERLAELSPSQPHLYREYAEELAEKRRDPEARDAAIRLFYIAAVRGDGALRRGALLGLVALARTPQEERRFRAAAYLYDPQRDGVLLTGEASAAAPSAETSSPARGELLAAIRHARRGQGALAQAILNRPAISTAAVELLPGIVVGELLAAAGARQLTDEQLALLLRAELQLDDSAAVAGSLAAGQSTWSRDVRTGGLAPLPALRLETLTEFDPAACLYRGGHWVRP
jgi:hypothetical protein